MIEVKPGQIWEAVGEGWDSIGSFPVGTKAKVIWKNEAGHWELNYNERSEGFIPSRFIGTSEYVERENHNVELKLSEAWCVEEILSHYH